MKCASCGFDNEAGIKFCGNCGIAVIAARTIPIAAAPVFKGITCNKCGSANPGDSLFCEKCGTKLFVQSVVAPSAPIASPPQAVKQKTSGAWWLLPIFLFWLGGLIGWASVRTRDKSKASRLLWVGIAWSIIWIAGVGGLVQLLKSVLHFSL